MRLLLQRHTELLNSNHLSQTIYLLMLDQALSFCAQIELQTQWASYTRGR